MRLLINDQYDHMPWDALDALVFDVGRVLLRFDPPKIAAELLPDDPELQQKVVEHVTSTPYWVMLDHGVITQEEALEAMSKRVPELREAIRTFLYGWRDLKEPIWEGVRAAQAAKVHGKKLYILSNYHREAFAFIEKKYDFFQLFDGKLVSSHVRMMKPEPMIFKTIVATFGLIPERTLFIDDAPHNVESALMEGWQGFCYQIPGSLDAFIGEENA